VPLAFPSNSLGHGFFWLQRLLFAMLLACYKRSDYARPAPLARLVPRLEPTSVADLLRPPSLVTSCRASSFLSEVGGADLKQSGLLNLVPSSATQNLAYLPCRIASHSSTFCFFARGVFLKKSVLPAAPTGCVSLVDLQASFCPPPRPLIKERFHAV
jgi:hypothetical protein